MPSRFPLVFILLLIAIGRALGQEHYAYPLYHGTYNEFEGLLHQKGQQFHTAVRPYRIHELNESIPFDSLRSVRHHSGKFARTLVGRKLVMESLIHIDSSKFQLFFDPVFHMDLGWDVAGGENHALNTRGFVVKGSIGRKLSFFTAFWENQSTFMPYMTQWIDHHQVVPGQGRIKDFTFDNFFYSGLGIKANGYDYLTASGTVSFTPCAAFNVQLGNDKHFIGEGYRSLLLSDAAFNYPFLKLTTKWRGLQYVHLLTQLQDNRYPVIFESGFKKKWATFHYLSANIGKRVQIGIFEGIVYRTKDSEGNGGFDWNFINPLMMIRPVQFGIMGTGQNVMLGLNIKVIPFNKAAIYGQLAVNNTDFSDWGQSGHISQKLGWQLGFKAFDLLKVTHLGVQLEYNAIRPYMYAHELPIQSYMHMSQPLGHPLGANFHELLASISYQWRDLSFLFRNTYANVGRDSSGVNLGNDPYMTTLTAPEQSGNRIGQGLETHLIYQQLELAYIINRASNLSFRVGMMHRYQTTSIGSDQNLLLYFGLRTDLRNLYYDF